MIFDLFFVIEWILEAPNMGCSNYISTPAVTNRKECQENCVQDSKCVGILYSYKSEYRAVCFVCKDDKLQDVGNDFGFYRRSGNVQGYAFKLVRTIHV